MPAPISVPSTSKVASAPISNYRQSHIATDGVDPGYRVDWLPIAPNRSLRVLVFKSPSLTGDESKPRPLHLDVHGGAFVGGLPESDAAFCARLAHDTGAVVVSTTYRYAPKYTFPAAIDDVDAVVAYLRQHALERYNADASLMTVSGFSAGANLALGTALSIPSGDVKAAVTFYGVTDLRLSPGEKPKPAGMPAKDPLAFLQPLFDSYAASARAENTKNPRFSPIVADVENLPENILMVIPGIDILAYEQMTFIQRLKEDGAKDAKGADRRFEMLYDEKGFHGYLEVPSSIVPQDKKDWAFGAAVKFIADAHQKYRWHWGS
ncbi:hypothetical protein V491_02824 [Pseudogymnoascus sp. VKM F-3775]|nr:hypothetical protein V491_02824 [Pseudogymnoascus sp. VKM F-3775]